MKDMRLPLVVIIICLFFCGGCSPKVIPSTEIGNSTEVIIRERPIHDTAFVEIPKVVEKIVTKDTASHLENDFGSSDAVVSGGMLYHSLETKPQTIYVPYEVIVRDTTIVKDHNEKTIEYCEVEKNLTWWQKTRMIGFNIMIFLILASLAIKYRGSILKLVKLLK